MSVFDHFVGLTPKGLKTVFEQKSPCILNSFTLQFFHTLEHYYWYFFKFTENLKYLSVLGRQKNWFNSPRNKVGQIMRQKLIRINVWRLLESYYLHFSSSSLLLPSYHHFYRIHQIWYTTSLIFKCIWLRHFSKSFLLSFSPDKIICDVVLFQFFYLL